MGRRKINRGIGTGDVAQGGISVGAFCGEADGGEAKIGEAKSGELVGSRKPRVKSSAFDISRFAGKSCSMVDAIEWAYVYSGARKVNMGSCPSAVAWKLMLDFREDASYMKDMFKSVASAKAKKEEGGIGAVAKGFDGKREYDILKAMGGVVDDVDGSGDDGAEDGDDGDDGEHNGGEMTDDGDYDGNDGNDGNSGNGDDGSGNGNGVYGGFGGGFAGGGK